MSSENKISPIQDVRLLDNVLQFSNVKTNVYKPIVQSIKNVEGVPLLEVSDIGKYIRVNSADDINITIYNLDYPIGGVLCFEQSGEGVLSIVGNTGITILGEISTSGQYKSLQVLKVKSTEWIVIGGTTV